MVFRTYVEKRQGLAPECEALLTDCRDFLGVQGLRAARIWNRYDVEGIEAPLFENACRSVFSEPPLDLVSDAADTQDACAVFAVEPLPGQFDQRADSASQCIQLLSQGERPRIRTAKVYALYGTLSEKDIEAVKHHVINPVESREASLAKPETLEENLSEPKSVASVDGFTGMDESALSALLSSMGLAMDLDDLKTLQAYFRDEEHRDPTVTEVRGGGRKIYRQKGTGNARHGDKRAPIFVGGGVVFGPRPCDYSKKVNKSTRRLALRRVLGDLIAASKVSTVSEFSVADGKTKSFIKAVKDLTDAKKVLVVAASFDETTYRAARNVQEVLLMTAAEVNIEQLMNADAVILVDNALETLASRTA